YANFMADVGSIKNRPKAWQDMFFPDIHGVSGNSGSASRELSVSACSRRLLLPLRREARIEALALFRHLDEQFVRRKTLGVFLREAFAQRDEFLRTHHVDVAERSPGIRRIAEPEDRTDIGLAYVREHAFLEATRGFQRLDRKQAVFQFLHVDLVRILLRRLEVREAGPQPLRTALRIIIEALGVLASVAAALFHHLLKQRLLPGVDRLGAEIGFGGFEDLPREIHRDLVVER